MIGHFWILAAGILLDRLVGDPDWLWRRLPHPVVWFGKLIDFGDKMLNGDGRSTLYKRRAGAVFLMAGLAFIAGLGIGLSRFFAHFGWLGVALEIVVVAVLIAHHSLAIHVRRVGEGYVRDGLAGGRLALSMIVGRDTSRLDESEIARGAIESLAENFSDGVVAPVFWYALAGLPGLLAYKFLNTADSMIAHKTPKYLHFGRATAKCDDVANWLPARLSAILVAVSCVLLGYKRFNRVMETVLRDAGLHRSPNAGWPEAAFAAGLDLQLGGPRIYAGEGVVAAQTLNAGGAPGAGMDDLARALRLFAMCGNCLLALIVLCALI
ncbi:MAG: adenosylcobinamide-phosphate synthase CbiB [Pseudomonadota bacterium]